MPAVDFITSPVIQWGFAGYAVLQLAVIVWMIRGQMRLQKSQLQVINANTNAIETLTRVTIELRDETRSTSAKVDAWAPRSNSQ